MLRNLTIVAAALAAAYAGSGIAATNEINPNAPTILMGEMWFAVPGGPQIGFAPGENAPDSIITVSGAETGKLEIVVTNVGNVLHEIRSPLFMAAKEVKVLFFDPDGVFIAEAEGTDMLEVELAAGYTAVFNIDLAGAVTKSFDKDPNLVLTYEISCHVTGHYEAGMRALLTLVGSDVAS